VLEHLADLGLAAAAVDLAHERGEAGAVRDEAGGAAFAEAAEIDQLHVEPARTRRRVEHAALKRLGEIPCWLPTHGGVEGEDQPPATAGGRDRAGLFEKGVNGAARRRTRRRRIFGMVAHGVSRWLLKLLD